MSIGGAGTDRTGSTSGVVGRRKLVWAMSEIERLGLSGGTSGNVSMRTARGMLITPTGVVPAEITPRRIVRVEPDGTFKGAWRPSSEWHMHAAIYAAFPQARAIVHAHPDHSVALSCLRMEIPAFHYMVAGFGGDNIRCSNYAPFGSSELGEVVTDAMRDRTACLIANHGMICFAQTIEKAVQASAKFETLARQYVLACHLGTPIVLSRAEMLEVGRRYSTYGQQEKM